MALSVALPAACYPTVPAEITPDLARSCPDKMSVLFQVQLLGRSIDALPTAFRLLLDLGRQLIPYDRAVLLWHDDPREPLRPVETRGFGAPAAPAGSWDRFLPAEARQWARPFLLVPDPSLPPELEGTMREAGCASVLSIPIYVGDRIQGVLQFLRDQPPGFALEEAHLARVFTLAFEAVLEHLFAGGAQPEVSFLDHATGVFNQRYLQQQLEREVDRARRSGEPMALLMVELGDWEDFRNHCGPAAADAILREIAQGLETVCRKSDTLARYRDDLFSLILPRTPKTSLGLVAQRALEQLEGVLAVGPQGSPLDLRLTLCGIAYPEDAYSAGTALEAAWKGLEAARLLPGRRYYQLPSPAPEARDQEILDGRRAELLREPALGTSALLRLFTRLALDVVPADRVSVMVLDGDDLVIQVAVGFDGQEDVVRTTRVPLSRPTVSAWVVQHRAPLLVRSRADAGELPRNQGAAYRGDSFFSYPLLRGEELLGVVHFSNRSDGEPFTQVDLDHFAPVAGFLATYLDGARKFDGVRESFLRDSLFSLVDLAESQIPGMAGHSPEVARLAQATARRLGLADDDAERLWVSGRLHDLGKVSYRTNLLSEPRALSPRERALTLRHPLLSWKCLENLPVAGVDRDAILYHHEREDGSGYLRKGGEETPLAAKILAVADVFQSLTSDRPYRPAIPAAEALRYLRDQQGTLFDPIVLDAFEGTLGPPSPSAP
ncbi:MAG: HD domain-containing phosphohydrolase [Deferrisomatales bacterium]